MDEATFRELADACRQVGSDGLEGIARYRRELGDRLPTLERRELLVLEASRLIGELAPHERLVRRLVEVGALVDFPAFTANTVAVDVGSGVLIRAEVTQLDVQECEVALRAGHHRFRTWVDRRHIVGFERGGPSLWASTR